MNNTSPDENIIDYLRDFLDRIEKNIINGKIIDMSTLDKELNEIKDEIYEYNTSMNEWYDQDYHENFNEFNKIFDSFESHAFIFNELSFVSIHQNESNESNESQKVILEHKNKTEMNIVTPLISI